MELRLATKSNAARDRENLRKKLIADTSLEILYGKNEWGKTEFELQIKKLLNSESDSIRIRTLELLTGYAHGTPPKATDPKPQPKSPIAEVPPKLTPAEWAASYSPKKVS